jgi:hypothetical protein
MLRTIALLSVFATPAVAQEKTFDFTGIDSIDARNGVSVTVIPGDEVTVTATALSGDVEQLIVRKFGPWLALNRDTRWFIFPYGRTDEIEVTITLPSLRNIKAFDTAAATASGFDGDALRAEAIQGGTVQVTESRAADVTLVATEGGTLTLTGTCETLVAEAIQKAKIEAANLVCDNVAATSRTGATVTATAVALASTVTTQDGTVDLQGNPQIVEFLPGMEPEVAEPEG